MTQTPTYQVTDPATGEVTETFPCATDAEVRLEQVRAVEAPGVTHLKYRILPGAAS